MIPKQIIYPMRYLRPLLAADVDRREADVVGRLSDLLSLPHPCLPLGRARTGIYLLVRSVISPGRTRVLLSPYTIPDVVNMVRFAGGDPVFIDHEPRSTHVDVAGLSAALDATVAAVLLTHYHVNQRRFHDILELCRQHGVALFEDCAISLGGTIGGQSVGSQSSGCIFSLSGYKFLNYAWGGMLYAQDEALQQRIATEVGQWPRFRNLEYRTQLLRTLKYDLATRPGVFDLVTAPLLRRKQRGLAGPQSLQPPRIESVSLDESLRRRPGAAAFAEWQRKIDLVPSHLEHRRRIAAIYRDHFADIMIDASAAMHIQEGSCFVNFPIWIGTGERDRIFRQMVLDRFDVGLSLYPNVHDHPDFREMAGKSSEVSRLVSSVITLPTHPRVSPAYAKALAIHLKGLI